MKKNFTTQINFLIEKISGIKKVISNRTEYWFSTWDQSKSFELRIEHFNLKYHEYFAADIRRKSFWFFLLFLGIPGMLVLDFAGLKDFFDYLGYRVGGSFKPIFEDWGWTFFGIIELLAGIFIITVKRSQDNANANSFMVFLSRMVVMLMIIIPAVLIVTGYALSTNQGSAQLAKTGVLATLSIIVHTLIFTCIEDTWKAIEYFFNFLPSKIYFNIIDPQKRLKKIRPVLKDNYIEYEKLVFQFREAPYESQKNFDYKLGKREQALKDKLTSILNEDEINFEDKWGEGKNQDNSTPNEKAFIA